MNKLSIGYKKYDLGYKGYLKYSHKNSCVWRQSTDIFRLCPHDALVDAAILRKECMERNGECNTKSYELAGYANHTHIEVSI